MKAILVIFLVHSVFLPQWQKVKICISRALLCFVKLFKIKRRLLIVDANTVPCWLDKRMMIGLCNMNHKYLFDVRHFWENLRTKLLGVGFGHIEENILILFYQTHVNFICNLNQRHMKCRTYMHNAKEEEELHMLLLSS